MSQTIKLRKYQEKAVDELLKYNKACLEASTGYGKSIVIAELARRLQDDKILMIVPSKELVEQNKEKLDLLGVPTTLYSASVGKKDLSRITLGTPLSLVKADVLDFDTILIDEAQFVPIRKNQPVAKRVNGRWTTVQTRPTYWKIIDKVKQSNKLKRIYGFTGTPYRLFTRSEKVGPGKFYTYSKLEHIGLLWQNMVRTSDIRSLQDAGYLAKTKYKVWDVDYSKFKFTASGEIKEDDVKRFENETSEKLIALAKEVVVKDKKECGRSKVIIFVNSIAYVEFLSNVLNQEGIKAAAIHSKTKKKDREKFVESFRNGDMEVLVNDTVFQVGFDSPNVSSIIWSKLTSSPGVYVQSIGRGLRVMPDKDTVNIYDFAGSYNNFGPVEDIHSEIINGKWEVMAGRSIISGKEMKFLINTKKKMEEKWQREKVLSRTLKASTAQTANKMSSRKLSSARI